MKNIAVLTVLVIIISAFTANNSAHCQELEEPPKPEKERTYRLSVEPQAGFVYGQAFEYVYPENTRLEFLSELRWDMKAVFYGGLQLDFSRADLMNAPGFFSTVSFKAGIPADSGKMEDRDWMSEENGELTHFSSHTNRTGEFFRLDVTVGASLPVKSYFYIKPFFSFSWMRFSFAGRDGYGKYAKENTQFPGSYYPIDNNPDMVSYEGRDVIRYTQNWLLAAAGFSIGTNILYPFSFIFSFQISPFTYCYAMDEHLTTKVTYLDYTGLGLYLEPAGGFSFDIGRFELSLELAWRYIGKTKGQSFRENNIPNGEAGAGLSILDTRFLFRIRIF
jgi:outer membrane protease